MVPPVRRRAQEACGLRTRDSAPRGVWDIRTGCLLDLLAVGDPGYAGGPAGRGRRAMRIHSLAVSEEKGVQLDAPNSQLKLLAAADIADLLSDLGRSERQELLDDLETEDAADALELMSDEDAASLLGDAPVERAAELLSEMEPDEAVDALREMGAEDREELLQALGADDETDLRSLLSYDEDTAAGMMTSAMVVVPASGVVADAVEALRAVRGTPDQAEMVILVDPGGVLVDDVTALELLGEDPGRPLMELAGQPWPVTVQPDAPLGDVVDAMRDNMGASVVVDADNFPLGHIHADDLVDALGDAERRWPWQRMAGGTLTSLNPMPADLRDGNTDTTIKRAIPRPTRQTRRVVP